MLGFGPSHNKTGILLNQNVSKQFPGKICSMKIIKNDQQIAYICHFPPIGFSYHVHTTFPMTFSFQMSELVEVPEPFQTRTNNEKNQEITLILSVLLNYTNPASSGPQKPKENPRKHKEKGHKLRKLALEHSCSPSWSPLHSKQKENNYLNGSWVS